MQCIYKPPNEAMAKILIVSDTLLLPHQWRKTRLKDRLRFTITYGNANYLLEKKKKIMDLVLPFITKEVIRF